MCCPTMAGSPLKRERHTDSVEHDDPAVAGLFLLGAKRTAEDRLDAKQREEVVAHIDGPECGGLAAGRELGPAAAASTPPARATGHSTAHARACTGLTGLVPRLVSSRADEHRIGIAIGERREQHAVDEREDRGVGADADRRATGSRWPRSQGCGGFRAPRSRRSWNTISSSGSRR